MTALLSWAAFSGALAFVGGVALLGLPLGGGLLGLIGVFPVPVRAAAGSDPAVRAVPKPLGVPNRLTVVRLALVASLAGHALWAVVSGDSGLAAAGWAPCLAYAAAALGDGLDGRLARRSGAVSGFGARLDAETDALGIAAASTTAVLVLGVLPAWCLVAGFARYLLGIGLLFERRLGRPPGPLPPSPFRRRLAGFQMGLLAVCLAPGIRPEWAAPSAVALGGPFLLGFLRDYLAVTGRLDPAGRASRALLSFLKRARRPAALTAAVAAALLGALRLTGAPTGAWALAAFFFAWLLGPEQSPSADD